MGLKSLAGVGLFLALGLAATREARADWPMFNHDIQGSRHNPDEHEVGPANAGQLTVKWSVATPAPVSGTPVVKGNRVYAGDFSGAFYALRARDGNVIWQAQAAGSISASALVHRQRVIFGDQAGYIYGLDAKTGAAAWQIRPNDHPWAAIYGAATPVGPYVAMGISSNEEIAPMYDPSYPCCSFRGSVVLIDPDDGRVVWQSYFVTPAEAANGASGVAVWSTPTYDPALGLIYVTTGDNYSDPTNALSDAIVALDAKTGAIVWSNQRYADDSWNINFPPLPPHPDYDFGDSAQIYRLADGRKVVGAGQKSGFYHVLDAATGAAVYQSQFEPASTGGIVGGLFADSAFADGVVFANGGEYPLYGDVVAFTGDAKHELWRFHSNDGGSDLSGVAVANGVVYFSSVDGNLYALRASSGALLKQLPIGANTSGPSVSDGQVYVGTGDAFAYSYGFPVTGAIVALGLPSHQYAINNDD